MERVDLHNTKHYYWKGICEGWHLVEHEQLSVIIEKMPAYTSEDMHYHCQARQFFFMLSGQATMKFEDREVILESGTGIEISPMEAHQMRNDLDLEITFMVISSPKSHGDRVIKA